MEYNLNTFIEYWKKVFSSENPLETLLSMEGSDYLRKIIREKFDLRYYPEPFYGYLEEDISNDILFLLLNPGQERVQELLERFPAESLDESRQLWNENIKDRHLNWTNQQYHAEERKIYLSEKFRDNRLVASLKILNQYDGGYIAPEKCFLHTAEFFPFRSDTFSIRNEWIFELESTKHLLGALKEISTSQKTKSIFAVSQSWFDILESKNNIFEPERIMRVTLKKKTTDLNNHHFSHRMAVYRISDTATPILVYKAGGARRMNLPTNKTAVKIIRHMLGIEGGELPKNDDDFNIIID